MEKITIPEGETAQAPIHLAADRDHEITIGRNGSVVLLETNPSAKTTITLESGATVQHVNLCDQGSEKSTLHVALNGLEARAALYGLYILKGEASMDHNIMIEHHAPHCESETIYRGILNDTASGTFNGRIYVHKGAQKTSAYLSNKNILLSDTATINAKPELEIFADDVKCHHGATVGQLDSDALFYLRARGIPESDAQRLLLRAFAGKILEQIPIESIRQQTERLLCSPST